MTVEEFSNEFDTLLNSYAVKHKFGNTSSFGETFIIELDEYEKSVYLTKAQDEILLSYYKGHNIFSDSYDKTEEVKRYLSSLIKTLTIERGGEEDRILDLSYNFYLPDDVWFIVYESAKINDPKAGCKNDTWLEVKPATHDEIHRLLKNPYKGPNDRFILRLDKEYDTVELISKYNIDSYLVRYIAKPSPIILVPLTDGLSIKGETSVTECALHEALHSLILQKAVELALIHTRGAVLQK